MIFFTDLPFRALQTWLRGVDPVILLALICLGLGACIIPLLAELEKSRLRWRENLMKRRRSLAASRMVPYRRPPDRER